ncbi:MAG: helix-turn-helix domain-containing protein [Tannerella sp.]|jgi:HTH-type transcriptional regulator/antitoxin HigA|nr:helix-turn-helix domain-containing protein [Tannerella sp.]
MNRITNDREYYSITKRIDELLSIVTDENYDIIPEAIELDFLSGLVEEYEKTHYPVAIPALAEVLKLRIYEMGINQGQLAAILHVSPSRISEYLSGKEPTLRVAKAMYEKLSISANTIFGVNPGYGKAESLEYISAAAF